MKKETYTYEIELYNGIIIKEGEKKKFKKEEVVRVSFIPHKKLSPLFPRHDIITGKSHKFIKRFRRVFMDKHNNVKECLHCLVTDKYRFYLYGSNGHTLITDKDYDLYI